MSDIQCSFSSQGASTSDMITARLKKPVGFKGAPLFADDRSVNPENDRACMIRGDPTDPDGITYALKITDFSRCGVLKRNVSEMFIEINAISAKITFWFSFLFAGIRSRTNMVSTISRRRNAIGSRAHYNV